MILVTEQELRDRRLPLAGTWNLRDVGGYPTGDGGSLRRGRLFRSCSLHQLDDDGRQALARLGLRTVVDLRDESERAVDPDLLDGIGVNIVHLPLLKRLVRPGDDSTAPPPARTLAEVFASILAERGSAIVAVIRTLSEPGALPAIVHCTAGKDRTGVVIAFVLGALGVPDEVIAADFAATALFLTDENRASLLARSGLGDKDSAYVSRMLAADPDLMLATLEGVRRKHGGAASYLVEHGLLPEDLARLREELVEPLEPAGEMAG